MCAVNVRHSKSKDWLKHEARNEAEKPTGCEFVWNNLFFFHLILNLFLCVSYRLYTQSHSRFVQKQHSNHSLLWIFITKQRWMHCVSCATLSVLQLKLNWRCDYIHYHYYMEEVIVEHLFVTIKVPKTSLPPSPPTPPPSFKWTKTKDRKNKIQLNKFMFLII